MGGAGNGGMNSGYGGAPGYNRNNYRMGGGGNFRNRTNNRNNGGGNRGGNGIPTNGTPRNIVEEGVFLNTLVGQSP